eukprot:TCONS_00014777-protein
MHRGGTSPGRGRGGGPNRRGGRGGRGRGGGHPSGLSGKDIGLYYARRGKERKKIAEVENRSVVTLSKKEESHLTSLLREQECKMETEYVSDPFQEGASNTSAAPNSFQAASSGPSSSTSVKIEPFNDGYSDVDYDSLLQQFDGVFKDEEKAKVKVEHAWQNSKTNLSGTHYCSLETDDEMEQFLKDDLKTKFQSQKFNQMLEFRKKLPSYQMRKEIMGTIAENQVCVIDGQTGCGKTTQVAQFILEDCIEKGRGSGCHIICTQPRRISAVSVAERVASERNEALGKSCGYQIRLDCKLPRDRGSILYCTTGILLQRLVSDPYMLNITHIILDEIHERDIMSDFLLIIIKDVIPHRPDLKVILMSATLNAEEFSQYFGNCPMLHIPGFTFPVQEHYLEDTLSMINYRVHMRAQQPQKIFHGKQRYEQQRERDQLVDYLYSIENKYAPDVLETIENMDFKQIDVSLVAQLIQHICSNFDDGAVLVFLPGWGDITKLHDLLMKNPVFRSDRFVVIPLHSMLPTASQKQIFETPPVGVRKIVIATNIAETSITIPDVVYVINGGKTKVQAYDVDVNVSSLMPQWGSKASARQRRGRAGRVKAGVCFHLFTQYHWDNFADYTLPEILRTPLESLCLQIKQLRLGRVEEFLSKAMQSPEQKAIENAIKSLKQMGAFDDHEELTALGYHLARLPVVPRVGRMILFGAIFSCLDPVLTIAGSLDFKEPFYIPLHKEREADEKRRELAKRSQSDYIMLVNAFKGWEDAKRHQNAREYCWRYFLSESTLRMIENMKKQFAQLLYDIGFLSSPQVKDPKANCFSNNTKLVKAVMCAGLYPHVIKIVPPHNQYKKPNQPSRPPKLYTEQYGRVKIHPKSVNEKETNYESLWMVYHKIMKSTSLFVHDCSVVTPFALLFFGGTITFKQEEGMDTICVDDIIKFHSPLKIANLVKRLRVELDGLLSKKITTPSVELFAGGRDKSRDHHILTAIIDLITTETVKAKSASGYK